MKKKKVFRSFRILLISLFLICVVAIVVNPYRKHPGFSYRLIKETIEVNASAKEAFEYLGNSANARDWSVFVDHISPLNASEIADGEIHSRRRCFKQPDETGIWWDEEVLEVNPNIKRQLSVYNLHGFLLTAGGLRTEQLYEPLDAQHCKLSLTLFFAPEHRDNMDIIKMFVAAYVVRNIFKNNLKKIKYEIEHNSTS